MAARAKLAEVAVHAGMVSAAEAVVSEAEGCRARLDQRVHLAGASNLDPVDEVVLLVSARLDAWRARPQAAAAREEVLDQCGEWIQRVDHDTVDGPLAHEIDGGAGQEDRYLQSGGDAAIGD